MSQNTDPKRILEAPSSDTVDFAGNLRWVDALPVGVGFYDLSQRARWVNRGFADIFGIAADELEGTALGDVAGTAFKQNECPVAQALTTGGPATAELTLAHHPKEKNSFVVKAIPVRNANSELLGATVMIEPITDRMAIEKALKKSEMRLKEAQRLARIGSWELDLTQNQLYWSDEIYHIFQLNPESFEATYEAFLEVVHPDDRQLVNDAFTRSVQNKEPYEVSHRLLMPDGGIRYVQEKGKTFFDHEGHPLRSIGTVWDITARKQQEEENLKLQQQYHQSQRMETVGRLAGGVAHDFNNMLSVILGRTDLMLESLKPEDDTYQSLLEIQHAAERSAELIRQLLAFARRQTMTPVPLNLNDVIGGMTKMLNRLIGEQIEMAWFPEKNIGTVKMDPAQLEQIMANLCVNARDAINGVGHITIETHNTSIDDVYCARNPEFAAGDYVMLAVSDDGCGMDAALQQQIFEPFFTTKQKGGGTGLGLATVFGIVKQNDGFIRVNSTPGQGTTFEIYFRRHREEAVALTKKKKRSLPTGNGEVILLVEDEDMVLDVNKRILEKLNYRVLPANSPSVAIEVVKNAVNMKISVLMTDFIMPEMTGAELAKKIEAMLPGIRTLYTSAYTADVVCHQGVLHSGVHFLQKPVCREALALKIDEMLRAGNATLST